MNILRRLSRTLSGLLIGPANVEEDLSIKSIVEGDEQPLALEEGDEGQQQTSADQKASDATSPIVESGSVGDSRDSTHVSTHGHAVSETIILFLFALFLFRWRLMLIVCLEWNWLEKKKKGWRRRRGSLGHQDHSRCQAHCRRSSIGWRRGLLSCFVFVLSSFLVSSLLQRQRHYHHVVE